MRRLVSTVLFTALLSSSATSTEFANIYGTEQVQEASRQASASALRALEQFFAGLRFRELRETSGASQFKESSDLLSSAAQQMDDLLGMEAFPNRDFNEEERELIRSRTSRYSTLKNAGEARSNRVLFGEFASVTSDLADRLGSIEDIIASTGTSSQGVLFSRVAEDLQAYLELADIVTLLNRPR